MYVDQNDLLPYKMAIGLKAYVSVKGMHSHALSLDQVAAFGLPLRLTTRIGFFSTFEQNYCGPPGSVDCDMNRARIAALHRNLFDDDSETFVRRYYKNRFMSFFGDIMSRWLLWKDQAKLDVLLSYRGRYYRTGDFKNKGPYKGSLYEKDFSHQKTDGYLSTAEIGLMLDKRDNEPAPTSGYWLEGTVRGGSWLIASAWDYLGVNFAARFYLPFDADHRVVFASQTILDAIIGDLTLDAISRIGGSQSLSDYTAIGGQYLGRGIREQLYVGKLKAIEQVELRVRAASFALLKQNFDVVPAAFADFAATAADLSRLSKEIGAIYTGFGAALRLHWNKTFIIRADLGVSPSENFSPKFYLVTGSVF
jgi:outer membrane protein assembly factor BamA